MMQEENVFLDESEKPTLKRVILSITSLISLSHSITVFPAKWKFIRIKLEDLFSNLAALEQCESSGKLFLTNAVESISATLKKCDELANQCSNSSYSGKLLMQSDLDKLSAKLDSDIKRLSDIYAAGLLAQRHAIVVSRPSDSASKEDIRFYISDLLSRMRIGSSDMKKRALIAFNDVVSEDDRYAKIAVEIDGYANVLVKFLEFHDSEIQEEAAKSVSLIAGIQSCKSVLIGAGIIAPLFRVLESGTELCKEFAARCLMKVTENSDNAWSVSAQGGVTILLKICNDYRHCSSELISLSCSVLNNLIGVEEIKRFMIDEGAIALIIELLSCKDEGIQICCIHLLQSMAYKDNSVQEIIIKEGGIHSLVSILDPKSSVTAKTREVAFRGITNLCSSSYDSISVLIDYSFMDHILYFLRYSEFPVQELALKASFWLCGTSEKVKKVMGDAGFMPAIVKFLDSNSFEIREMASETLSSMLVVPSNRRKFIQDERDLAMLLQMLDPRMVNSGIKKRLLSILMLLTNNKSARRKIVRSGYLKNIEKIAAEEPVSDAKKILSKLYSNRFTSFLKGLWSS